MARKPLKNISEIRRFFHRNDQPIYFVSATNFNLLGIDEWVKNFKYINYIDCYDGRHPNVLVPSETPHAEFTSIEDINNYLLGHKEVVDYMEGRGGKPKLVFLMFDEKTEDLAKELGAQVWFPKAKLRSRVDNKIETVRIGDKAGVPSAPNTLSVIDSWEQRQDVAAAAGLGDPRWTAGATFFDADGDRNDVRDPQSAQVRDPFHFGGVGNSDKRVALLNASL